MKKLMKRALSLALTLCLLLSIIPAVSAADNTTETYVYSFAGKSGNLYNDVTDISEFTSLDEGYASGENWYLFGHCHSSSTSSLKYNSNALYIQSKYNGFWNAIMIKVEKSGYYNLSATILGKTTSDGNKGSYPDIEVVMLDDSYASDIAAKNYSGTSGTVFDSYPKIAGGVVNGELHHATDTNAKTYAYLGNTGYLEAGNYIIGINPKGNTDTKNLYKQCWVYDISLTPGETGDAFVQQVSTAAYSSGSLIKSQVTSVYQLAADLNAPNAVLELGAQDLALNGHTLTVGAVSSAFVEGNETVKLDAGVVSGLTGNGTLKVTGAYAPMLPYGGQQTMLLKGTDNTYQFAAPALISGEPFTGQSFMEDPANTGFAFQIDMAQAAKALVAGGDSGVKVSMEWTLGDTKGTTVQFSSNFVKDWGAGNGDTFYIEVKDIYKLVQEYGVITCTPKISGGNVSFTGKPIVFTGEKQDWDEDGELRVLLVSNSFGIDTHEYAWQVAESILRNNNVEFDGITVGTLYHPNCSIDEHIAYLDNPDTSYNYYRYTTTGAMTNINNTAAKDGIVGNGDKIEGKWDYVCLSTTVETNAAASYANLETLIDKIETLAPTAKLVWNMTWAVEPDPSKEKPMLVGYGYENSDAGTLAMYKDIVKQTQEIIVPNESFTLVTHPGTAVQNARTSFMGSESYCNSDGFHLTRDSYHMSKSTGRYIAALTYVSEILKDAVPDIDVTKLDWKPSDVPADEARVALESVKNAIANPYAVTNSAILTQDVITVGQEIELEIEGEMAWSSTSGMKKFASTYAYMFASTQSFTRETLPVGSVIEIAEGYVYEPHAWINGAKITYKPNYPRVHRIVIDELWWSNYSHRAFNIRKVTLTDTGKLDTDGNPILKETNENYADNVEGFHNALKIYLPN